MRFWMRKEELSIRRPALAGQTFADPDKIACATPLALPGSTPAPAPGSGDDPSPSHAPTVAALCTSFAERSTSLVRRLPG
jgi:hypothetical protein